jgi:hypothetical protein
VPRPGFDQFEYNLSMFKSLFKKPAQFVPKKYVIFNVETFNTWFNDPHNEAVYAHAGIFLRLDKLSISHIHDYIVKCHGLVLDEWDFEDSIQDFYFKLREDWLTKINNSENI